MFSWDFFLHCSVRTKKLLDTKVKNFFLKIGKYFWGLKIVFLGLAVLVIIVNSICPLLLPLVSLLPGLN